MNLWRILLYISWHERSMGLTTSNDFRLTRESIRPGRRQTWKRKFQLPMPSLAVHVVITGQHGHHSYWILTGQPVNWRRLGQFGWWPHNAGQTYVLSAPLITENYCWTNIPRGPNRRSLLRLDIRCARCAPHISVIEPTNLSSYSMIGSNIHSIQIARCGIISLEA